MTMGEFSNKTPLLLMVSGGSDSIAMLEIAHAFANGVEGDELVDRFASQFGKRDDCELSVLHVNHMLRGADSDADEAFVIARCEELEIPCEVVRVDVGQKAKESKGGIEAVAREERYRIAEVALQRAIDANRASAGHICTAHTLDDRVETFFMRVLVGTGPGGLASIPRERGNVRRPLLDATRDELRIWLREHHPASNDDELWREDATNYSGDNFRSQVRMDVIPVLRQLRPGFERQLAQTMDLMAEENSDLQQQADSLVYRGLVWDGREARFPLATLQNQSRPMARRLLRSCLLVVNPSARLESRQIDRVLDHLSSPSFVTDVSGALRVSVDEESVRILDLRDGLISQ